MNLRRNEKNHVTTASRAARGRTPSHKERPPYHRPLAHVAISSRGRRPGKTPAAVQMSSRSTCTLYLASRACFKAFADARCPPPVSLINISTFFGFRRANKSRVLKVHFATGGGSSSLNRSRVLKVQPSRCGSGVVKPPRSRQRRRPRSAVACASSSRARASFGRVRGVCRWMR